jgi:hypothetical protein
LRNIYTMSISQLDSAWYAPEIWHMNSAAKQNAQALSGIEDICQQSPLRFWLAKDLWTSVDSFQPQSFTTWEHLEAIKKWKSTNSRNLCSLTRFQNCRGYSAMVCYGYWVSWFTSHPAILDVTTESFSTLSSCEELHQSTERLKKRYRFISWGTASKLIIDMVWSDIETLVYYISICLTIYYSPKFHLIIKWQIAPAKRSSLPCYPPNLRSHPCGTSTQSKIQRIKEDPKRS